MSSIQRSLDLTRVSLAAMTLVNGTFDVTSTPHAPSDSEPGAELGRVTFHKQFHGGLEAASVVEMLSATTDVNGSAAYVALERVKGTLDGRTGSFVLVHTGTMRRGHANLAISVVPDSATSELKGLTGKMMIEIVEGKHLYSFDYSFDD
jgi:hypothetical protein